LSKIRPPGPIWGWHAFGRGPPMDSNQNLQSASSRFDVLTPELVDLPAERHDRLVAALADLFEDLLRRNHRLTSPPRRRPPGDDEQETP
jgi:hypothetical protein